MQIVALQKASWVWSLLKPCHDMLHLLSPIFLTRRTKMTKGTLPQIYRQRKWKEHKESNSTLLTANLAKHGMTIHEPNVSEAQTHHSGIPLCKRRRMACNFQSHALQNQVYLVIEAPGRLASLVEGSSKTVLLGDNGLHGPLVASLGPSWVPLENAHSLRRHLACHMAKLHAASHAANATPKQEVHVGPVVPVEDTWVERCVVPVEDAWVERWLEGERCWVLEDEAE